MDALKPAVYSYHWADGVVQSLVRSHTRAAKTTLEILGIKQRDLANYLVRRDGMFVAIKELMHRVDKIQQFAQPALSMSEISSILSRFYPRNMPERLLSRLTARMEQLMLEEQVLRQRGGGLPADPSQPLLFGSDDYVI